MCGEGMADVPVKNQEALNNHWRANCNEVQVLHWQNRGNGRTGWRGLCQFHGEREG